MSDYRLILTLWDPDRGDRQLLDACAAALRRAGGSVTPAIGLPRATFYLSRYPAFVPKGEKVQVRSARVQPGPGGLVQFELPYDHLDRRDGGWAAFHGAVADLLADARPMLATCTAELPADELPDPPPESADLLFRAGWVDPARLDSARQAAFGVALRHGTFAAVADGWWWSAQPQLDPAGHGHGDPEALSIAVYEAWTGRAAARPGGGPIGQSANGSNGSAVAVEPVPVVQLWFWAADRDDETLLDQVAQWAATDRVEPDRVWLGSMADPGWVPVVVEVGTDPPSRDLLERDARAGLARLRRAVQAVRPSWAALQIGGGLLVPGDDPDTPTAATLPNVWVNTGWLGPAELGQLLDTLAGAHREDVAGGVLLVTSSVPLRTDDLAPWCHDPDQWWSRVVRAATILGAAARASRPVPGR